MQRITSKFLHAQIERLNTLTGMPDEPYKQVDGKNVQQPGNYHLSGAYGGHSLHRMCKTGGVEDVFRCGHITARALSERIDAYITGIESVKP